MDSGFLRSKVTRRLTVTFMLGALIPAIAAILIAAGHGAPMADFRTPYPYIILVSLGATLFLGHSRIGKSLKPLDELRHGTGRLAAGELTVQMNVNSGDEFQSVASSINTMADKIHDQMRVLKAVHNVGRTVLSTLDTAKIVEAVLSRTRDITPCDAVVFGLAPVDHGAPDWKVSASLAWGTHHVKTTVRPTITEINELRAQGVDLNVDLNNQKRSYLDIEEFTSRSIPHFLLFPLLTSGKQLTGVIALGFRERPQLAPTDLTETRRFADQVTVALSHARLMVELNQLNLGTINALARTIDASSKWTAGHSERVTYMALEIGKILRLPDSAIETLHRGGLLHDIGKIGIPSTILDKAGRLTDDEMRIMQNHTRLGAEILAPLPQYADALPIVRHHHEKMDGTGYPDGLSGNQIPMLARLLAVADVFDALRAERPYRASMPEAKVISIIKDMSGPHLDPKAVKAFLAVMDRRQKEEGTGSRLRYARESMVYRQITLEDGRD